MAQQFIFTMLGLNKYYGQKQVLKDINLCFYPGAKIGIVGENGSGKSTVLRIMSALDRDFQGQAEITRGYKAGIVLQDPLLDPALTVRKTLEGAFGEIMKLIDDYNAVADRMAKPLSEEQMQSAMDRMAELQDKIDAVDGWSLDRKLKQAADALFLPDDERVVGTLSGGEKRRVALCKAILEKPDLLLLDEPTNHLDPETVDWLEEQLKEYPGTVIIVTHDRYFLNNVTKWILELDAGRGIPYEGNYTGWLEQKLGRIVSEERQKGAQGAAARARPAARAGLDPHEQQAAQRPDARAAGRVRADRRARGRRRPRRRLVHPDRPRPGTRRPGDRDQGRLQAVRRQAALQRPRACKCPRAPSSASSAPTARARRRCSS